MERLALVGAGELGHELASIGRCQGMSADFYPGKVPNVDFEHWLRGASALGVTISDRDYGKSELGYVTCALRMNIPVATCVKGMCSYRYEQVQHLIHRFGWSTVVGGASKILIPIVMARIDSLGIETIEMIANGTINYILWRIQQGCTTEDSIEEAIAEARQLRLTDPGATTPIETFRTEFMDTIKKAAATFNFSGIGPVITPGIFRMRTTLSPEYIEELELDTPGTRFVVTMRRAEVHSLAESVIFYAEVDSRSGSWLITGEFVRDTMPIFGSTVDRQWNALALTTRKQGRKVYSGKGAGAPDTAAVMFEDIQRLMKYRHTEPLRSSVRNQ